MGEDARRALEVIGIGQRRCRPEGGPGLFRQTRALYRRDGNPLRSVIAYRRAELCRSDPGPVDRHPLPFRGWCVWPMPSRFNSVMSRWPMADGGSTLPQIGAIRRRGLRGCVRSVTSWRIRPRRRSGYEMRLMAERFVSDGMIPAPGDVERLTTILGRPLQSYRSYAEDIAASAAASS